MNNKLHKLHTVSLVNWYLFRAEDIDINGLSILLTGRNGSGKSSVADAIQTVFAGADEKKLAFNAASSDGKKSGRTIKSYVLGTVTDSEGNKSAQVQPRKTSNSYVSLTFKKPNGKYYSFGCAFYATKDRHSVDKYFFGIEDYSLSQLDYMMDDTDVLTYKDFVERLRSMDGRAQIFQTSHEFRMYCADLMSEPGIKHAISPDALFRAITQGLKFKPQKDVTEFIRANILPEHSIDVVRIENDYKAYCDIQKEIEIAKDRLEHLKKVINYFKRYQSKSILASSYSWAVAEAKVSVADGKFETAMENHDRLVLLCTEYGAELCLLEEHKTLLKPERDNALSDRDKSDLSARIDTLNFKKDSIVKELQGFEESIKNTRVILTSIESTRLASIENLELKASLKQAIDDLSRITDFDSEDITNEWPRSNKNLIDVFNYVSRFDPLTSKLRLSQESIDIDIRAKKQSIVYLTETSKKLAEGKASLTSETQNVISFLAHSDIIARPICDFVESCDEKWQKGIEGFLGVWNREALLILNDDETIAGPQILEKALVLYRDAIKHERKIRSVKILNPEKISEFSKKSNNCPASDLITTDNPTVMQYLKNLLNNVNLVETVAELRLEKRAITPDGMVAGNGSISGGNRIEFLLFGKRVRLLQAEQMHARLIEDMSQEAALSSSRSIIQTVLSSISDNCQELTKNRESITTAYSSLDQTRSRLNTIDQDIKVLENNPSFEKLRNRFETLDNELNELNTKISDRAKSIAETEVNIIHAIGETDKQLLFVDSANKKRNEIQQQEFFNQESASNVYNRLSDELSNDVEIMNKASSEADVSITQASTAKEKGLKNLQELFHHHDLENKEELNHLGPLDCMIACERLATDIEKTEIILHEEDAKTTKEQMLTHFRSQVATKLGDNLQKLKTSFSQLNASLKGLQFNNTTFKFTHKPVAIESLKEVLNYVTSSEDTDTTGGLFDETKEHPGLSIIQDVIADGRLTEVSDYRNFYTYDIVTTDQNTGAERHFSELLKVGSGGEQQSPFYVALGASFMNAYKLEKLGSRVFGGAALAIFDEAMAKMDGVNTEAALKFFDSIGLQVILAAPPEAAIKTDGCIQKTITVIKDGGNVFIDNHEHTDAAIELLKSDNPMVHPEIAEAYIPAVKKEFLGE